MYRYTRFLFVLLASGFSVPLTAQLTIKGKVLDASNRQPLVSASVYCENTTLFTTTDAAGNFSLSFAPGGYNLIVSYTGYRTQSIQVAGSDEKMLILLGREENRLKEVVVKGKSRLVEDGWNNYGSYFIQNFIGTTPNAEECRLQNPEVLKFYYYSESNKIKVFATAPLTISNKALGYTLSYALDSFVYLFDENLCSYRGYCRYTEMQGSDNQKKVWSKNRKRAYEGSVLHFMRSYYNGSLPNEGFDIALQQDNDPETFDRINNPFDSTYYEQIKENKEILLQFPRRIRVSYLKKVPEPEYLEKYSLPKKLTTLSSAVDLKEKITVKENGYYYHQLSWISYNYWSWKNMADMLPYDYKP